MSGIEITLILISVVIVAIVGGYLGNRFSKLIFPNREYTPKNAIDLLKKSKPEEWNEVRIFNPDWNPTLIGLDLKHVELPSVNLSGTVVSNTNFEGSDLIGSDFSGAVLSSTDFGGAILVDSRFDKTNWDSVNIEGAILDGASFFSANIQPKAILPWNLPKDNEMEEDLPSISDILENQYILDELSPWKFIDLVSRVYQLAGYEVEPVQDDRDLGFDFIARISDKSGLVGTTIVECKKYPKNKNVGVSPIRVLLAKRMTFEADKISIVTTGEFSKKAKDLAKKYSGLMLISREDFISWIERLIS